MQIASPRGAVVWRYLFLLCVSVLVSITTLRAADDGYIYFSTVATTGPYMSNSKIKRARLDGSGVETILSGPTGGRFGGIAFDPANGHLYSGDLHTLIRANLNGSNRTVLVTNTTVTDIEIDLIQRKIYWSDTITDRIYRASLDGTGVEIIHQFPGGDLVEGIALAPSDGKFLYSWNTSPAASQIRAMNLNGTIDGILKSLPQGSNPFELEYDPVTQQIYWNNYGNVGTGWTMQRTRIDGSGMVETVFTLTNGFCNGIHFDPVGRKLYYMTGNGIACQIHRTSEDGAAHQPLFSDPDGINYIEVVHAAQSFTDDFEASMLNPFWSKLENSGTVTFPFTNRVYAGTQAVRLSSTANTGQKNIELFHVFSAPVYGRISVWVFDSGADQLSANYLSLYARNSIMAVTASLFTQDYDLGSSNGGNYYFTAYGDSAATSVDRTAAWHHLMIDASATALTLKVDDTVVYSGPGGIPFDKVGIEIHGPDWRPAWSVDFDEFEFAVHGSHSNSADIVLSQAAFPPSSIAVGSNLTITVSVTNLGPLAANNVVITNVLPQDVMITSLNPSGACVASNGVVICSFGTLSAGVGTNMSLIVTSGVAAVLTNKASVSAIEPDVNPANNAATITVTSYVPGALSFSDNFESATLNPFWSLRQNAGSVLFPSTIRSHTGSQSVQLQSTANSGQKNIELFHQFPAPIFGNVSIWVFDSGADEFSANYLSLSIQNRNLGQGATIFTQDYDLGPANGGNYYFAVFGAPSGPSLVDRTKAWHHLSINATPHVLTLKVDGVMIYSGPGGKAFDELRFEIHGPTWRPSWEVSFDDFEFTEFEEFPTAANISVAQTATPEPAVAGSNTVFTIAVHNGGPSDAQSVTLTNFVSGSTANVVTSATTQGDCTISGDTVVCSLGSLTNGQTATIRIGVVAAAGVLTNFATIASPQPDGNSGDNSSTLAVAVQQLVETRGWDYLQISNAPEGMNFGSMWARTRNEAYVSGWRVTPGTPDVPEGFVYRWNGTIWAEIMRLPQRYPGKLFGVGSDELFLAAYACSGGAVNCGANAGAQIFYSTNKGSNWTQQTLPAQVADGSIGAFGGFANNVHATISNGRILRYDGVSWAVVFTNTTDFVGPLMFTSTTEGYYVTCWGWGRWDPIGGWRFNGPQFDFCDAYSLWGTRDTQGALHLYAAGANNFQNGVRVWKINEAVGSFGGKYDFAFQDGNGFNIGIANGIWGSSENDIYVVGGLASAPGGLRKARIYNFDGVTWRRVPGFEELPQALAVTGTAADDVWVALMDFSILHLRPAQPTAPPVIISQPSDAEVLLNTNVSEMVRFQVISVGERTLAFQWYFNSTNVLSGETNASLAILVPPATAGDYHVTVQNDSGVITSAVARLTVIAPPTIMTSSPSMTAFVGSNVTLFVTATGRVDHVQWKLNGDNIPNATNATLTLPNVGLTNGGSYTVALENPAGVVITPPTVLTIILLANTANQFVDAVLLPETSGSIGGTNTVCTKEFGEPRHAGRIGGRSAWYKWVAPADGLVTLDTIGSAFDTLLGVYTGAEVSALVTEAQDEDSGPFFTSRVLFNGVSNRLYYIAVDGFASNAGPFVLKWAFAPTNATVPVLVVQPQSVSVYEGSPVAFEVAVTGTNVTYQWFRGGEAITGANDTTLIITNVNASHVDYYTVRVTTPIGLSIESIPAFLEIGVDGVVSLDKIDEYFFGEQGNGFSALRDAKTMTATTTSGFVSVTAGMSGAHVLNTDLSTTSSTDPQCHSISKATQYLPIRTFPIGNTNILVVDTVGSEVPAALGIYTLDHNKLACARSNAPGGQSFIMFQVANGGKYELATDAIAGLRGRIQINWQLMASFLPEPGGKQQIVPVGSTLVLTNQVIGLKGTRYWWRRNGTNIAGATNAILILSNIMASDQGLYSIVVSNSTGSITNIKDAIIVADVPVARVESAPTLVAPCDSAQLQGNASGAPPLALGWLKTGRLLGTNLSYRLLTDSNNCVGGTYSFIASNRFGVSSSAVVIADGTRLFWESENSLAFCGCMTHFYELERSTNLLSWQSIATNAPGAAQFNLQTNREGFYRVMQH